MKVLLLTTLLFFQFSGFLGAQGVEFWAGFAEEYNRGMERRRREEYKRELLELERRRLRLEERNLEKLEEVLEAERQLRAAERQSREETTKLVAELSQQGSCVKGPKALRQMDHLERQNLLPVLRNKRTGQTFSPEQISELYISECSHIISELSAAGSDVSDNDAWKGLAILFRENLDYMKWWLQNRRQRNTVPREDEPLRKPRQIPVIEGAPPSSERQLY